MQAPFSLRHRLMLPADADEALELLPPWLPLDSGLRGALPGLWCRLLTQPGFNADVIEDLSAPAGRRLQALGMALALDARWAQRLAADPPSWVARHVYADLLAGRLEPPSDFELGRANALADSPGVPFLVLHYQQRHTDLEDPRTLTLLSVAMTAFRHAHAGHRIAVLYQEAFGSEQAYMQSTGMREQPCPGLGQGERPVLFAMRRDEALRMLPGSHLRDVFEHRLPRCYFTAAERRLLRRAVFDEPDEDIAVLLDVSVHTVKKLWAAVYARVARQLPELLGDVSPGGGPEGVRGPEKRRLLIAYLRQHPEELRPHGPG